MSCHSRIESGLKKTSQDIILATNREVRMSRDFFVCGHKVIDIYRCWNYTNCRVIVYLSPPNFAPRCVRLGVRDAAGLTPFFSAWKNISCFRLLLLSLFCVLQQPASTGSCVSEGTSLWRANYWLWDAAGIFSFVPSKSLWL